MTGEQLYFEDMVEGQRYRAGPIGISGERIKLFAQEFDPQAQHTDEAAARATPFGELVASGWHTAAITMRLMHEAVIKRFGGGMGLGVDGLKWIQPVRPGDELTAEIEVGTLRDSKTKPEFGIVPLRIRAFNQRNEPVLVMQTASLVRRRGKD